MHVSIIGTEMGYSHVKLIHDIISQSKNLNDKTHKKFKFESISFKYQANYTRFIVYFFLVNLKTPLPVTCFNKATLSFHV